ncbi:TolC family outer membrane protein [Parasphingorhabdus sp. SCSIO 66989]|uniref:TolC family outer membrane protein n=2 Tax=Alterisphingorhabdus coralli TaxID=3071408 RepID=A0AA97FB75_9SPHN|nr:TolC family outer membrane protein [Parasphingorhabdus sp. SCSIO 66989]WOE76583.1 TolC family outer membrane protein [Parasphingorhabdus sp. SCSIO 66989]
MRWSALAPILAVTMLAATPAQADTLREALVAAYMNNPTLTGARAEQRATDEGVPIALADGRPNSRATSIYQENFLVNANAFAAPARQLTARVEVNVPVYRGGQVRNAIKAAKERVDAGQATLRGTESSIFSQTVAAYMDVIRDEALVRLNRNNVDVLETNLQATSDRFEIGDLTRTDVAQSEARLETARSDLETAISNLIRSKEVYIQLVGRPPENLAPPPPLPGLPEDPNAAVGYALENNPDIEAAKEQIEAAEYDVKSARGTRKPQLDAFASGDYANFLGSLGGNIPGVNFIQQQSNAQVGLSLTVPIYQGGRPGAQIRQAQARTGVAIEQEIAVERDIIAQTRAAYASWQASLQVIESAQRAVDANALSLEGVRAENSVGNRTILDILNAEQELVNAQAQLVVARRNAYVAGFTLLAAMGRAEARDLGLDGGVLYDPEVNYDRVRGKLNDFATDPDPTAEATRTDETPAQTVTYGPIDK